MFKISVKNEPLRFENIPPRLSVDMNTEYIVPSKFLGHKTHASERIGSRTNSPTIDKNELVKSNNQKSEIP